MVVYDQPVNQEIALTCATEPQISKVLRPEKANTSPARPLPANSTDAFQQSNAFVGLSLSENSPPESSARGQAIASFSDVQAQTQPSPDDQLLLSRWYKDSDTVRAYHLQRAFKDLTARRGPPSRPALASLDSNALRRPKRLEVGKALPSRTLRDTQPEEERSQVIDSKTESSLDQRVCAPRLDPGSGRKSEEGQSDSLAALLQKLKVRGKSTRMSYEERRQRARAKLRLQADRITTSPRTMQPGNVSVAEGLDHGNATEAFEDLNGRFSSQPTTSQHLNSAGYTSDVDFHEYWRLPPLPLTPTSRVASQEIEAAILAMLSVSSEEAAQFETQSDDEQVSEEIDSRVAEERS